MTDQPSVEREVERKVTVPPVFALPDLKAAVPGAESIERGETFELLATYYDTVDLRLARWGVTLRRRAGGKDEGWHLKLPAWRGAAGDRDEIALPFEASDGAVPRVFDDCVTPLTRGQELRPVATLRTARTPITVHGVEGPLVTLVDDTVSVEDGNTLLARFREVEVELANDDYESLDAAVESLLNAGGVVGTRPKLVSALGPRALAAPDVPSVAFGDLAAPAHVAVRATIALYVRAFLLQDVRVRLDLPDSVHQMRVAARRLRSALRTFRPLLEREWADELRERLATAAGSLGDSRDLEVQRKRLDRDADRLPDELRDIARSVIDPELIARQERAREAGLAQLRSAEHLELLEILVAAAAQPAFTDAAYQRAAQVLPELLADSFKRLSKEVRRLTPEAEEHEWHRARIVAKRARYAAESLAPVMGEKVTALAVALASVTDELGTLQDTAVSRELIADLVRSTPGDQVSGYALGLLDGIAQDDARACKDAFRVMWPDVKQIARSAGAR